MLSVREQMVLSVEKRRWATIGSKEAWIRDNLGMSLTRHAQVLNALVDRPDALEHDAQLVRRLQRLRDRRRAERRSRVA